MRTARTLVVCLGAILLLPLAATAQHRAYEGRTGLPAVFEGKDKVWVERGNVNLVVRGSNVYTYQDFRLHYPGGKLEHMPIHCQVGVREDFYQSKDSGDVTPVNAKGFSSFALYIDGRRADSEMKSWEINDKKDTATRWRTWWIDFRPNQIRRMQMVSVAPLGWEGGRRTVEFVSKDLGHWRDVPDDLEIRFQAPRSVEPHLAGLEPKPDDWTTHAVRWVYRKVEPKRDIYIQMPDGYPARSGGRS